MKKNLIIFEDNSKTQKMQTKEHKAAFEKMCEVMNGEIVTTTDAEMKLMNEIDDTFFDDSIDVFKSCIVDDGINYYTLRLLTNKD